MSTLGSLQIPTSAFIFLSLVLIFLFVLVVALLALNKLLCFANCKMPSAYYISNTEQFESDSESDDSDDDIYNNYTHIEKTAEADKLRFSMRSIKEKDSRHDSIRSSLGKDSLRGSIKSTDSNKDILAGSGGDTIEDLKHVDPEVIDNFSKKHNKVAIIRVNLFLDTVNSKLKINLLQAFDLRRSETKPETRKIGFASPTALLFAYQVHCTILPAKKLKFKTKTRQGVDPNFNESFYVPKISLENIEGLSVRFRIYAGQNSTLNVLGQCTCDLSSIDLTVDTEYNLTMNNPDDDESLSVDKLTISQADIQSMMSSQIEGEEDIPELMIGLSLNSNTGRLTVEIIRGIRLSKDKNKDFYVKLSLFSSTGQELSYTKTSVRKNTTSPVFRESFMFQIALFQMKEVTLMISVFSKKSIHRKNLIGWIALGCKSSGEEEASHWNEVGEGVKTEVIRSHKLHQNNNSKKFLQ